MSLRRRVRHPDANDGASMVRGRRGGDGGFTLVEVVIAVVLMGTVSVAALSAVVTSIKTSSVSRSAAEVETAIVNAADRVNRAKKSCDYTIYAQAAVQIEGWPASAAVVTHEYYIPSGDPTVEGQWVEGTPSAPACPGVKTDLLVQRVTIQISDPNGDLQRSIQVVKSDV